MERYEVVVDPGGLSIPPSQWGWLVPTALLGCACVWFLVKVRDTKNGAMARVGYALAFLISGWLAHTTIGPVTEAKWQRYQDRQLAAITRESGYSLVSSPERTEDGALLNRSVVVERDGAERDCWLNYYLKHPGTGEWTSGPLGRGQSSDTAKVVLTCLPERQHREP